MVMYVSAFVVVSFKISNKCVTHFPCFFQKPGTEGKFGDHGIHMDASDPSTVNDTVLQVSCNPT